LRFFIVHNGCNHTPKPTYSALLDKMLGLIDILALKAPFYFVADA
jgi:hypothetical protein